MHKRGIALAASVLLAGLLLLPGAGVGAPLPDPTESASASPSATAAATATPAPSGSSVSFPPLGKDATLRPSQPDATVSIPDSKLKAALYAATGLSTSSPIKRSDLAQLTGGLDLTGKNIVKTEGLQYCENLAAINLTDNNIADVSSSFSKLTKLKILILDGNKLTKINDSVYALTGLTALSARNNTISTISDKISGFTSLTSLDLSNNKKIKSVPSGISRLSKLVSLDLSGNNFSTISREVFLLANLETLDLSDNVLKELPKEAATTPRLVELHVEENILNELPTGLGNAPSLLRVYASVNRLTIIEPSLLNGRVSHLSLDVNRITDLPQGLTAKTFDTFTIEWNFIDMSEGSDNRKIADSVNATAIKAYLRQLKYLPLPQAKATTTTVHLQWQMMEDGLDGDSSWKVKKYQIYIDNNGTWGSPIGELDRLATQYVATGLKADKPYKFQIGVEYELSINGVKSTHRYFTPVEIKTLSLSATPEPTIEPTDEPPVPTETPTENPASPAPTDAEAGNPSKPAGGGNRTTLVVVIIVAAAAVLVFGLMLALSMARRNRRPY